MEIRPITLRQANAFVEQHHRHHSGTAGCKFAIGLFVSENMVGVAICGRPVSRYLDDGLTLEVNRLCTTGEKNACSMLYGASCRVAKAMGYRKCITYTLESEDGASLRASNFRCCGKAGGLHWTGERNRNKQRVQEFKTRWERVL